MEFIAAANVSKGGASSEAEATDVLFCLPSICPNEMSKEVMPREAGNISAHELNQCECEHKWKRSEEKRKERKGTERFLKRTRKASHIKICIHT